MIFMREKKKAESRAYIAKRVVVVAVYIIVVQVQRLTVCLGTRNERERGEQSESGE